MIKRQIIIILLISFILTININRASYGEEHEFCDEWRIWGLGSVYLRSDTLKITENEITWPGCKSAPYKIISKEEETWELLVPQLNCKGIRKDNGEGYIMVLKPLNDDELSIKVHNLKEDSDKKQELAWGHFYRIPFDHDRNLFGKIGNYPITAHLNVTKKGDIEGHYYYDKYKKSMPLRGKVDGTNIVLTVSSDDNHILEIFDGKYVDGEINGVWKNNDKVIKFHLVREPWEDHFVSCKEMQKYPERVFSVRDVDLGSGAGSPNGVDYKCEGGLATLEFMKKLYDLTEVIRSEGPQHICSGSIVHAHWRYYHYSLLKAGLAPNIHAADNERSDEIAQHLHKPYGMYQNALHYFKLWAHQSIYNFILYAKFWEEYNQVKPRLIEYYKIKFKASPKKATYYAEEALSTFVRRSAGSYQYDLQDGEPDITSIEKAIINPNATMKNLKALLSSDVSQEEIDQALRVALLYQRDQNRIELLLKSGARINSGYESALFFALRNYDHVKFLLKRGANVNYENGFGKTALYYAIGFNDHVLAQLLIANKADTNHKYKSKAALIKNDTGAEFPFYQSYCLLNHTKRTPLMHAAQNSDVEMIKILLKNGAQLDVEDELGYNAADYAAMGKKQENMDYLKSLGLKENDK